MQYDGEKREKLNRVEKRLYSRNSPDIIDDGRSNFKDDDSPIEVESNWKGETPNNSFDELASRMSKVAQKKHNILNKIFILSVVFFIIAAGIAVFVFMGGMNFVSSKNVDIKIVGPISVAGGQETSFDIQIINNNNIRLDSASLLVEYPSGTKSLNDLSQDLNRERFSLESISPGQNYTQVIKPVFFGEKDTEKEIKISLEYRVENSSALFYKEKNYTVTISSAPVIITPTYPKEVNSNQEVVFNIEVASNSSDRINDFLVSVEYPFGFNFIGATPAPTFGDGIWKFSNFNSGDKKNISIRGTIVGQDNEERVFRINTGTANPDDERMINVSLGESIESILIKRPFIGLSVLVSGRAEDSSVRGGTQFPVDVRVVNNLPERIFDVSVEVELKGPALNRNVVQPSGGGFYQSSNNTITWDKRAISSFSDFGPGSSEILNFRLGSLAYSDIPRGQNPEIEMLVTVRGERVSDTGSVERIVSTETRKVVLSTDLNLTSRVVRSIGNIENTGPIPPKAEAKTTYTIVWSLENSFNQAGNVEVRATLPPYVTWTNLYSPNSESVSYNQPTNEIVWRAGSVLPNTGFTSSKKEVYFQVELLPSLSQVGQSPTILGESRISGVDRVTNGRIDYKVPSVTTNFSSDPTYKQGNDIVVR